MMDISDLSKIAARKRMNSDAEKLREKVSRETAKIIKLKVAQDTAYWDLKEKLQQVESNHEKLQQNMVEVQMQYEAISGQYQEELRLRPDTLNKLSSTREICDVLEDYCKRLKSTLSRCKEDQVALYDAYQRSGQVVRDIKTKQVEEGERSRNIIHGLEEKVKLISEHQNQLLQFFTAAKQQADAEIVDLRSKLTSVAKHKDDLLDAQNELNNQLSQCKFDIEKKEEVIANLHAERKNLLQQFSSQASEARNVLETQDKKIKELTEETFSLKQAVINQEEFNKSLCEQNNALQEKTALLEDENVALKKNTEELIVQIQESSNLNQNLKNDLTSCHEEKQRLQQEIEDTKKIQNNLELELSNLKVENEKLESEKSNLMIQVKETVEESDSRAAEIEKLSIINVTLEGKLAELEVDFKSHRETFDEKIKELLVTIEAKEKEIDSKASTINQLMSELKASTDKRSKLEVALQKMKNDMETERDAARETENKMAATIGQLETSVRSKDDELSKQMSTILEMRNEKERLQEKIQSMQNTIDNIQKELTRPPPSAAARMQPELDRTDDNAVMLTPSHKKGNQSLTSSPSAPLSKKADPHFAVPRSQEPQLDNMLYTLFSDSSMEGDALDTSEVNRRFNALSRGEELPPAPLSALLRRRGGVPSAQGGLKRKHTSNDSQISLSQVKNNLKNKERVFFKNNKRVENKTKATK